MQYEATIKQVTRYIKTGEACFFLGAGISFFSPSDFPSGIELKTMVFDAICSKDEKLWDTVLKRYHNGSEFASRVDRLSPERVFGRLYEVVGDSLLEVFSAFRDSEPNQIRWIIAYCVRLGWFRAIFTTNFDQLLESALTSTGELQLGVARSNGDFEHSDQHVRLFKLHGCSDSPETILAALPQTDRHILYERHCALKECLETKPPPAKAVGFDYD